jgi:hypothetical protein
MVCKSEFHDGSPIIKAAISAFCLKHCVYSITYNSDPCRSGNQPSGDIDWEPKARPHLLSLEIKLTGANKKPQARIGE